MGKLRFPVVSANGLIPKSLDIHLRRLTLGGWIKGLIQKAVLLEKARILKYSKSLVIMLIQKLIRFFFKCLTASWKTDVKQRLRCVSEVTGGLFTFLIFPIPDSPTILNFLTPKRPITHLWQLQTHIVVSKLPMTGEKWFTGIVEWSIIEQCERDEAM
uniref:SFRICE_029444 n=1 Tax=Spodoptera frugiperda TaxID=7108 RepID=A0A2H1VFB0_SPOFR